MPGTGLRGMGPALEFGFMGLGPGAGPRRWLTWLAEFDLGRPISGGGAIWGPPPYGPGDIERGGPAYGALLLERPRGGPY